MPLSKEKYNPKDRLVNSLNTTIKRVSQMRPGQMTPNVWIVPTFLNSWVNFGGSDAVASYYIDGASIVHLKGKVKSGTINTAIFTLPTGYVPSENLLFPATSNDAFGVIKVDTSGNVICTTGNNTYVSLSNIQFRV